MERNFNNKYYIIIIFLLLFLMLMGVYYQYKQNLILKIVKPTVKDNLQTTDLIFTPINLRHLNNGNYEGWIVTSEKISSTGKFNIDENFNIVNLDGSKFIPAIPTDADLNKFIEYFITIENQYDNNSRPSPSVILKGYFDKNQVALNFEPDIKNISGTGLLLKDKNKISGVNFTNDDNTSLLNLPKLSNGWNYQVWINEDEKYTKLGKIEEKSKFLFNINNNVLEREVLFSIEPDSLSDILKEEPFFLIPLKASLTLEPISQNQFTLNPNFANFPKAMVTINQKD